MHVMYLLQQIHENKLFIKWLYICDAVKFNRHETILFSFFSAYEGIFFY